MPVNPRQRFTAQRPCPICGGWDQAPRGKGIRCFGFLVDDGIYAHCTRAEMAGQLTEKASSGTYGHRLTGDCGCGREHNPAPTPSSRSGTWREPIRTIVYEIKNAAGQIIAEHIRKEYAEGDKTFTWRRNGQSGLGGLSVKDLPLYGLPDLLAAPAGSRVIMTEGEKARDALHRRKVLAVGTVTGAKVLPSATTVESLVQYSVVLWPDNDNDGWRHMQGIATLLVARGISPKIVQWDDAPPKGDAGDFPNDDVGLASLLDNAIPYTPPPPNLNGHRPDTLPAQAQEPQHLTDYGNAERLIAQHGHDLRFCYHMNSWLIWNGQRWMFDHLGEVERRAKATVRSMYIEAAELYAQAAQAKANGEDTQGDKLAKQASDLWIHARKSEQAPRIAAMISLAGSESGIPVDPDQLDADPWVLNVLNGTLDLKTGTLRPHRREDMLTKQSPASYKPTAKLELWDTFLAQAVPDMEQRRYMQKAAGSSLTGAAPDDVLLFPYGQGGTGKGTFSDAMQNMMGDYATTSELNTFISDRHSPGPRPDLIALRAVRMVVIEEVDDRQPGVIAMLKKASGGSAISARGLHQNTITFRPQFKLWLIGNKRPRFSDDDTGLWRRIRVLPFTHIFHPADTTVRKTLSTPEIAGAAVLAWAVEGCLLWQKEGLASPPKAILEATKEYRQDMDPLKEWIEERTEVDPNIWTAFKSLFGDYQLWCKDNNARQVGRKTFAQRLGESFPSRKAPDGGRGNVGISLRVISTGISQMPFKGEVEVNSLERPFMRGILDSEMPEMPEIDIKQSYSPNAGTDMNRVGSSNDEMPEVPPVLDPWDEGYLDPAEHPK